MLYYKSHDFLRRGINMDFADLRAWARQFGIESLNMDDSALAELQTLDLSNRGLRELPECIGTLPNLQRLNVFHNELSSLPQSISKLPLQMLDGKQSVCKIPCATLWYRIATTSLA